MKKIYLSAAVLLACSLLNAQSAFTWDVTSYKGAFPVTDNTPATDSTNVCSPLSYKGLTDTQPRQSKTPGGRGTISSYGGRRHVFPGMPWGVHISRVKNFTIGGLEILVLPITGAELVNSCMTGRKGLNCTRKMAQPSSRSLKIRQQTCKLLANPNCTRITT